jgi:hypothetical protein
MFKKTESQKQQAETRKIFKDASVYLQQAQRLKEAFEMLDEKRELAKAYHEAALAEAGKAEAKRLLGETVEGEAEPIINLTQFRDGREKFSAAENDLCLQQTALEDQIFNQATLASSSLQKLAGRLSEELNEELEEAAARLTSVANRLYALSSSTRLSHLFKHDLYDVKIPSLLQDRNLYIPPVRHNPVDGYQFSAAWREDAEAVKLYELMQPFSTTYRTLQQMANDVERKREKSA